MKFDVLDSSLRAYEVIDDKFIPENTYCIARIDGRGFTKLTKEKHPFKVPFDPIFRDYMIETTKHLMSCGFNIIYGFTQSDEISLLFSYQSQTFSRKHRKYLSILAGEASAKFSLLLNDIAVFDCRLSHLPSKKIVIDYFRWRSEDARRNSLNAHCYWRLREDQFSKLAATQKIMHLTLNEKHALLSEYGIDAKNLPPWQTHGIGLYFEQIQKEGFNPKDNTTTLVLRKQLVTNLELPHQADYDQFILNILNQ